ncbi:hypothetical protein K7X08_017382 [Anisodus acutangulus]|uniref:Helicase ATP-binding domain-containing protein n=1 Tax=Anisodus acutangulus TaxID=402998 RepID=A0A9Q1R6A9_9SOLA|nr:hypothetical protein K7X08_017382 [Anisodus acutangulus]
MGLGKTIQTISFLAHLKGNGLDGPYLVIAPLSTLSNWVNEIERFVPSINAIIYHGDKKQRDEIRRKHMPRTIGPKFPIVVTSYEIAMIDAKKFLRHYNWKYLVVDEGQRLKNSKCKLLKELKHLPVENKPLLTGTPLQNNLTELWFDLAGRCGNEAQKKEMEEKRRAQDVGGYLTDNVSIGNHCKGKLNNLMIQLRKNCNHPDLLESAYDEQIVGQCGKFRLLDRLLSELFARKQKVLIFSQWTKVLDIMDYYFSERGFDVCRIDGSVKLDERKRQVIGTSLFMQIGSRNSMTLTTHAFYDSDWAMDRCHRIGQTKHVHVYRLATALSVEGRMLKRAFSKLKLEHVEEDLLALLRDDYSEEDKLVQTDISDEDLQRVLDRSNLRVGSPSEDVTPESSVNVLPLQGPGWDVVIPTGSGGMLSTLNS